MKNNNSTEKQIHIGIIDTGVDLVPLSFNEKNICGYGLKQRKGKLVRSPDFQDTIGHGTAITYILSKKMPNAKITMIKLIDYPRIQVDDVIVQALNYIFENESFDVINLSVGTPFCSDINKLRLICDKLLRNKTIIVSSFDNYGVLSYPAALDNVIGIDHDTNINDFNKYNYIDDTVNIKGCHRKQYLPALNGMFIPFEGNSFLTPHYTALVAKIIEREGNDLSIIKEKLKCGSMNFYGDLSRKNYNYIENSIEINKAVIFPFNKEVHSIARFEDMLPFKMLTYCNSKYLGNIGEVIGDIINSKNKNKIIDIDELDWTNDFDTFILSHVEHLSRLVKKSILFDIVKKCIEYKKNLYVFDVIDDIEALELINNSNIKYYSANINNINIHEEWGGKLRNIGKPILCVAGTSSLQGKFTVQLYLRKTFRELGIYACNVGTEPSSKLFRFEGSYPFGYGTKMEFYGWRNILAVNKVFSNVEMYNPEIIITGLQSSTIPLKIGEFNNYPIKQNEFILGCAPDAYILCINVNDDITFVKRTIKFLENIFNSKIICLCVNPFDGSKRADSIKVSMMKVKYSLLFRKKVFVLDDEISINKMVKVCIDYFR
ncbi:MAG: DUF1611 domain-containing protein [Eubacteriales bacterium]|nr:DUF1611 domain-containing protein [Eubacteriales bacterium]